MNSYGPDYKADYLSTMEHVHDPARYNACAAKVTSVWFFYCYQNIWENFILNSSHFPLALITFHVPFSRENDITEVLDKVDLLVGKRNKFSQEF